MTDEPTPAILDAAQKLMDALYDDRTKAFWAKTIGFTLRGSEGEDNGDWEITVKPTRIPEGREIKAESGGVH